VADEDLVFDRNALTDKSKARDFAVATHARALLNFDEGTNPGAIVDLATVQVDEVVNDYVTAESNVRSDYAELSGHEIGDWRVAQTLVCVMNGENHRLKSVPPSESLVDQLEATPAVSSSVSSAAL